MKDRPIPFSAPMVRAILEGHKTQTRRVVKPQPQMRDEWMFWPSPRYDNGDGLNYFHTNPEAGRRLMLSVCPYGVSGDRLWVRETWAQTDSEYGVPVVSYCAGGYLVHGATGEKRLGTWKDEIFPGQAGEVAAPDKWRPSIFMPRWASRITLEITAVRVERVQEISEADAAAEGIVSVPRSLTKHGRLDGFGLPETAPDEAQMSRVFAYAALWDNINGKRTGCAWADSPWVWVIEFKRAEERP